MIRESDSMKILYSFSVCYFVLSVLEFLWKLEDMQDCVCELKHEVGRMIHDVLYRALGRKQMIYLPQKKRLPNMVFVVFS